MLIDPLPIKLEQELKYEIAYAALSSAAADGRLPKGICQRANVGYTLLHKLRFDALPQDKSFITGDLDLPHTPSMRSRLLHVTNPRRTHSTRISHHAQQADCKLHADFCPCPA